MLLSYSHFDIFLKPSKFVYLKKPLFVRVAVFLFMFHGAKRGLVIFKSEES